jgi:hypothetical protein
MVEGKGGKEGTVAEGIDKRRREDMMKKKSKREAKVNSEPTALSRRFSL